MTHPGSELNRATPDSMPRITPRHGAVAENRTVSGLRLATRSSARGRAPTKIIMTKIIDSRKIVSIPYMEMQRYIQRVTGFNRDFTAYRSDQLEAFLSANRPAYFGYLYTGYDTKTEKLVFKEPLTLPVRSRKQRFIDAVVEWLHKHR